MTEEGKKAIEIVKGISEDDLLNYWEGPEEPYNAIQVVLNLIQKQDRIIKNQSYTNKKMKKKLDNYRKLTKLKERTIQKQDTEINKLKNVIDKLVKRIKYDTEWFYSDLDNKSEEEIKEYFMKEGK